MPKISALPPMNTPVASDDQIPIVDKSTGETKRIDDGDLTGFPDFGWTTASETWLYASWSSTTRIGVMTVPSDATIKYSVGMRIKITQSTGGVKYGIIHAVSSTTLTVFWQSGMTLNNEAISSPAFSTVYAPFGFDPNPNNWQVVYDSGSSSNSTQSATVNVWYNVGSHSLVVGIGAWVGRYDIQQYTQTSSGVRSPFTTLSTGSTTETDLQMTNRHGYYSGGGNGLFWSSRQRLYNLASQTTFYLNQKIDTGTSTLTSFITASPTRIVFTSAYL